jgi:hypothetical protein
MSIVPIFTAKKQGAIENPLIWYLSSMARVLLFGQKLKRLNKMES